MKWEKKVRKFKLGQKNRPGSPRVSLHIRKEVLLLKPRTSFGSPKTGKGRKTKN